MNHFKQHKPGWADDIRVNFDFNTQEELLNHEVVKRWKEWDGFCRFSINIKDSPYSYNYMLMAELKEGREWWVVGYLDNLDGITLPPWVPVQD